MWPPPPRILVPAGQVATEAIVKFPANVSRRRCRGLDRTDNQDHWDRPPVGPTGPMPPGIPVPP